MDQAIENEILRRVVKYKFRWWKWSIATGMSEGYSNIENETPRERVPNENTNFENNIIQNQPNSQLPWDRCKDWICYIKIMFS